MNLRRLEYFLTIAQTGSLRQASDILHVSTPALSKAMKLLEEEFETKLWILDGRKIILTDAGKSLLKKTPAFLANLKEIKESINSDGLGIKPVRIGTFEVFSTYFLSFLNILGWDNHALELHELLPGEVEKYIVQGDLDIGITYMPIPHPELDFMKVTSIEMGIFTKKNAFKGIPNNKLPFVIPVTPLQGVPTKTRGLDGWPDDAYHRTVLHKVTLMESALELCRQGRVAGYFPAFIVNEHNDRANEKFQLERRKTTNPCKADVFIVKRKSFEETQIIKQLAKAIRQIC